MNPTPGEGPDGRFTLCQSTRDELDQLLAEAAPLQAFIDECCRIVETDLDIEPAKRPMLWLGICPKLEWRTRNVMAACT